MLRSKLAMEWYSIQEGIIILTVTLPRNMDRLWLGGLFDSITIFKINLSLTIITEAVISCIKRFWLIITS